MATRLILGLVLLLASTIVSACGSGGGGSPTGGSSPPQSALAVYVDTPGVVLEEGGARTVWCTVRRGEGSPGAEVATLAWIVRPSGRGLSVAADDPGPWPLEEHEAKTVSLLLRSDEGGRFDIELTAALAGGVTTASSLPVTVLAPGEGPHPLSRPVLHPAVLRPGEAADLECVVRIGGDEAHEALVLVEETDASGASLRSLGFLADDGRAPDRQANDRIFSGTLPVAARSAGSLYVRARVGHLDRSTNSEIVRVPVTNLPVGATGEEYGSVHEDPIAGVRIIERQLLLQAAPHTSESRIREIVGSAKGEIVGGQPQWDWYQIHFAAADGLPGLVEAGEHLRRHAEVLDVYPNLVGPYTAEGVPPDSPCAALDAMRVPQAWLVTDATSWPGKIAVIDTGVDPFAGDHEDLFGLVESWQDHLPPADSSNPLDPYGHGTAMAGLIAARRNWAGLTGVAYGAKLLVHRAVRPDPTPEEARVDLSAAVDAITIASHKARLLNCSFSFDRSEFYELYEYGGRFFDPDSWETRLRLRFRKAVEEAQSQGSLVVASAGNLDSESRKTYPAALTTETGIENVISVGGTEVEGGETVRWTEGWPGAGSAYGDWVDLGAPAIAEKVLRPATGLAARQDDPDDDSAKGASVSAAFVTGAAALLWSRYPDMEAREVRERLMKSSADMAQEVFQKGSLDVFEAVFNGGFEHGDGLGWARDSNWLFPPLIPGEVTQVTVLDEGVEPPALERFGQTAQTDAITPHRGTYMGRLDLPGIEPGKAPAGHVVESLLKTRFRRPPLGLAPEPELWVSLRYRWLVRMYGDAPDETPNSLQALRVFVRDPDGEDEEDSELETLGGWVSVAVPSQVAWTRRVDLQQEIPPLLPGHSVVGSTEWKALTVGVRVPPDVRQLELVVRASAAALDGEGIDPAVVLLDDIEIRTDPPPP